MRKFTHTIAVATALVAGLALSGCSEDAAGGANGGDSAPLTIAVYPGALMSLPEYVGVESGIYSKHGLNVDLVDVASGPAQISAVASGSVDIAGNSAGNVLLANSRGSKLTYLNNFYSKQFYTWVASNEWLKAQGKASTEGVATLKGARVGIPARGSEAELLTNLVVKDAGLDPEKDITYVAAGVGQPGMSALVAGQIDAIVAIEPMSTLLTDTQKLGQSVLDLRQPGAGPDLLQQMPGQGRIALASNAEKRRDVFEKWTAAQTEIVALLKDPAKLDEVAGIYATKSGLEVAVAKKTIAANAANFGLDYNCSQHDSVLEYLRSSGQYKDVASSQSEVCSDFLWNAKG